MVAPADLLRSRPTAPPERVTKQLADATKAATDFGNSAMRLLRARRARASRRLKRLLWSVVGYAVAGLLGLVAAVAAAVMFLYGAAVTLASALGLEPAAGLLILGSTVLVALFVAIVLGKRSARDGAATEEIEARAEMRVTSRRLLRKAATVPGVVATAIAGFVAVQLVRNRPLRRAAVLAMSAARAANRFTKADPPA